MNTVSRPLISIAMTVFNAARFLSKTLESLLAQDYENFELVISDNASEDGSSEICRMFAERDNRIKYYRNITNMGPARNSYKATDLCSGDFIMPAADHDMYHPSFISRLFELLQQDESVVLAYPRTLYIDENDRFIQLAPDVIDTRGLDASQRFCKNIWEFHWMNMVYGLYRSPAFKAVWHAYPTIGPDHIMIAKLCFLGSIAQIDEPLFIRRRNRPDEDSQANLKRQISFFVNSNLEALIPWTRMAYEHIKVIKESDLADDKKEMLYGEVRKCFPARFGYSMGNEVLKLISESRTLLSSVQSLPNLFDVIKGELAAVAHICKFFYPDVAGLDAICSLQSQSEPAGQKVIAPVVTRPVLLQINTFYDAYLDDLYQQHPQLKGLPFQQQRDAVMADGFAAIHNFVPGLCGAGYDAQFIIANCPQLQATWLQEHNCRISSDQNWEQEVLRLQIEQYRPDVLLLSDSYLFDSSFLRSLSYRPSVILGWAGEYIPETVDWSGFDAILSNFYYSLMRAYRYGARATERFSPGFTAWLADETAVQEPVFDVVFVGQWTSLHHHRNNLISALAREACHNKTFSLGLYISGDPRIMPPEVTALNQGGVFGLAMHRALKSGRIAMNFGLGKEFQEAGNMRILESTGSGVFLLHEYMPNIREYFEPGYELETFGDEREMLDKIRYYLAFPDKRQAIAGRGQERCMRDHAMELRITQLGAIIQKYHAQSRSRQLKGQFA